MEEANTTCAVLFPTQTVWFVGVCITGSGFTVIVNVCGVPKQLFKEGVTVNVLVTSVIPLLIPVNAGILPAPGEERPAPIVTLFNVQL